MRDIDQGEAIRVLAPLAWRAADKMFKIISWMAIIVALRITSEKTNSPPVHVLAIVATLVFSVATLLQVIYLAARDPSGLGFPSNLHKVARSMQIVAALVLLMLLIGPQLYLDQIIDALANAKIR